MFPTPYAELNDVLQVLVEGIQEILGATFLGFYLQGSFAVGDFDTDSDVDFIVALNEDLSEAQISALQAFHKRIYHLECAWAQHLEGSYFPKEVLRDYTQRDKPLWYLDHGSRHLIESTHCNMVVVRWVVREYGITLAGAPPVTLIDPIPVSALREEILEAMRQWGREIIADSECIDSRFYQAFATLNYCRMLHDLHRGHPGSKRAGAEWVKATLAPQYTDLIDRAWAGRYDPALSSRQPADSIDLAKTVEFVRYILAESERFEAGERL